VYWRASVHRSGVCGRWQESDVSFSIREPLDIHLLYLLLARRHESARFSVASVEVGRRSRGTTQRW
jgi:hypothetical protein